MLFSRAALVLASVCCVVLACSSQPDRADAEEPQQDAHSLGADGVADVDAMAPDALVPDAADGSGADVGTVALPDTQTDAERDTEPDTSLSPAAVRVATYNVSLFRGAAGRLLRDLQAGDSAARGAAAVIQSVRPDILLLNEFDVDRTGQTLDVFAMQYLEVSQNGQDPIAYPYRWVAPSNTGVASGLDLNRNGRVGTDVGTQDYADDAFGFGMFEGQYGFAVLSRFPIQEDQIRTFQRLRWASMPDALLPSDPATVAEGDWYSEQIREVFRLSSKNHADIPIAVGPDVVLHLLASHPTPPAFDGAEQRNVRRNHDEIRLWRDYLDNAAWLEDDRGGRGGLGVAERFVIAGDLNSDPNDPAGGLHPVRMLLEHPRVQSSPTPRAAGAAAASARQGQGNATHVGDPAQDTADFNDRSTGNLRVDYVLPSTGLRVLDTGIFWPDIGEPGWDWVGDFPFPVSDHRLVWVDLALD